MSFLDDLYYGNIKPVDNEFVKNSGFDKALKIFCDCETELRKELDKDANDALTRLINSHNELLATTGPENFKIGFRLGIRMMCDAFIDKSDAFKDLTD